MALFRKKKKPKVCIIGLDGVPYSLLVDLAKRGIMETMAELLDSGCLHRMKASLPEISAVSWTNFMTGSNPATHGIFGFTDFKKDSYGLHFPNFLDLKKETFWDRLGERKKRCIIINQPSTYPARKINGILVSGFVAIDLAKAVYPTSSLASLERMDYQIDIDTSKSREDHEFLWQELSRTLDGRLKAFEVFWQEDWDYFEFVITGTDRLQHFLWNAYQDDQHPYHKNFLDYYKKIDRVIGKIVSLFQEVGQDNGALFLLSDHGFTAIEQEVYLNAWLEREGYLEFKTTPPQSLNEISSSSLAFAMDPNRIYLNLKEKFPLGCVGESEAAALKQEISQKLEKLQFNGRKVVRKIFDTHEIYSGPYLEKGPDLICLSEYGFDMKGSVKKKDIFGRTNLQGMHTWDDAFFWSRRDYGDDLSISDLASIIMENFS
jgi:predicted AlkP superfamily phosphohydrolase/phosphomutase